MKLAPNTHPKIKFLILKFSSISCALSTNFHYIQYRSFTECHKVFTTLHHTVEYCSLNWNIRIPIFLLYLHESPRVRTPCTLLYIVHFLKLHSRYELYTSIIHLLYYTTCAIFSSQWRFSMTIKWSWSCLKSISQNE